MFEPRLYLGFLLDPLYENQLNQQNSNLVKQFVVSEHLSGSCFPEPFLLKKTKDGVVFLGKYIGEGATLSEIELLEAHIYSLLKKLVPGFPYSETTLYIFPVLDHSENEICIEKT